MDLIEYLTQKSKLTSKKKSIKKKKKQDRIPRRARGFGQRHRVYRENKNKSSEIDTKILALLTAIVKQNQPQIQPKEALNPFMEREKQTYSMTFEPKVKSLEERLAQVEQQQLTMGEPESPKTSFLDTGLQKAQNLIQQQEQKAIELATINNKFTDYQHKWNEVIAEQESLNQVLDDIPKGNMNENAQEDFRLENVKVKENILSLQNELQEELNEASDLNDYKQFIDFQKQVLGESINNFVSVDNRLAEELVKGKEKLTEEAIRLDEEQRGFEKLQEQTFNEKKEIEKQNELLNLELVKSQEKENDLMDELNSITSQFTKLKEKVYQMETNPEKAKSPPRVEVEEIELPKPKPSEQELKKKAEEEEANRLAEEAVAAKEKQDKRDTDELVKLVKNKKTFSPALKEAFERLFGKQELKKVIALGASSAPKLRAIKQLLETKRGIEF